MNKFSRTIIYGLPMHASSWPEHKFHWFSFSPPQFPIVTTLLIVFVAYEIQMWLVLTGLSWPFLVHFFTQNSWKTNLTARKTIRGQSWWHYSLIIIRRGATFSCTAIWKKLADKLPLRVFWGFTDAFASGYFYIIKYISVYFGNLF